jgi:hypothetical protein
MFDRSIADWPADPGMVVDSSEELHRALVALVQGEPRVFDLVGREGSTLQIGLGGVVAFAQFVETDTMKTGAPPTFVALPATHLPAGSKEFLVCTTPTSISSECLLSAEEALRAARFFFQTGKRDPGLKWKRIC